MNGSVIIKGTKNGITLVLDENEEYSVIKEKSAGHQWYPALNLP